MMTNEVTLEIIKDTFTFLGLFATSYFSYRAVKVSRENQAVISTVAKKVDGLLEEKTIADRAIGNLEGRQELKDESKRIVPKS